ncbi:DapH/DapD/GlmU-related protein [Intrasporangium calvum]|uniref:PglD-related sugar-binding protein n=1 Tax=Intrasporangium calvum TaxID=53358 RepID=UPI000DF61724|nr:DapH/DapD/GlmU-related protein [Intrasporangium calvum]AXG12895.1 transferase [Intrasporangium calvum]
MNDRPDAAGLAPAAGDGPPTAGWVVFGAGGHARSVVDVLERLGASVVAVVGDAGGRAWPVDVLEDEDAGIERVVTEGLHAVVAIGASEARLAVLGRLRTAAQRARTAAAAHSTETGAEVPSSVQNVPARSAQSTGGGDEVALAVVAATATVAVGVELGPGTVVLEHAHVGPGSRLGAGVIVNTGAIVEHDCVVGEGSHVAPGAVLLGAARIGARSFVGSGARILPGVALGAGVTVGAGAVVTRSAPDGQTMVGVPARSAHQRLGRGMSQ